MSNELTGADLEHLDALSDAYAVAGTQITGRAADLQQRLATAVSTFGSSMVRLTQQASTLTQAIDDEVGAVSTQATAVSWSGANRAAFDGDVQRFVGSVRAGNSAIVAGIDELRSSVDQRFSPVLEDFGRAVAGSADGVATATSATQANVANQRRSLDEAANIGWTSA